MPILRRLGIAREVAIRSGDVAADRPFSVIVSRPPEFDRSVVERYAHAGVTAIVNRPTVFSVGEDADGEAHREAMREFVEIVTRR
jgi:hypothetical protein